MEVGTQKLLTSPASIIAAYIIDILEKMSSPDANSDWPLYVSHLPDSDNVKTDAGAIYNTTGINDMRSMNGKIPQHPGIQLRIRSQNSETGYAKIEDIALTLDEIFRNTVEVDEQEYEIQNASRTTPIVSLGLEVGTTKRRYNFTVNYLLTLKLN